MDNLNIKYIGTIGSRLYGLQREDSDHDMLGFYCLYKDDILFNSNVTIMQPKKFGDLRVFEFKYFINRCLKMDQLFLMSLFSNEEQVILNTSEGLLIYNNRDRFLSLLGLSRFKSYSSSMILKLSNNETNRARMLREAIRLNFGTLEILETETWTPQLDGWRKDFLIDIQNYKIEDSISIKFAKEQELKIIDREKTTKLRSLPERNIIRSLITSVLNRDRL